MLNIVSTTGGPTANRPSATASAKPADRQHRDADRAPELVAPGGRLEPGEVRQQRALHGLEELQRRARDEQHAEDDAGELGIRRRALDRQHRGVEQRLLGDHHREDRGREARAAAQRQPALGLLDGGDVGRRVARAAQEEPRHDEQRRERRRRPCRARPPSAPDAIPRTTASGKQTRDDRLEEHERAVELEALVAGEEAAREVARGVREHAGDEHPVQRRRAVEEVVLDQVAQRERERQERRRERALDQQRDAQVRRRRTPARARAGRRSCATAAARSAGRSPTRR